MANKTHALARTIHGKNPQLLVENITRQRVYLSMYWKEQCFGLTAETLIEKAIKIDHFGGNYSANLKPTPFMCLLLKMLQLQPEMEIVEEYIRDADHKYLRLLGAFYYRLVGIGADIYEKLEPLYQDYRKVRR